MSKARYSGKDWEDKYSPTGTFNGDNMHTIRDRDTGKEYTGRGHTAESARERAMDKVIKDRSK